MKTVFLTLVIMLAFVHSSHSSQGKLAVLPVSGAGVESDTRATVYRLLLSDVRQQKCFDVIPESEIEALTEVSPCSDIACAVDIGKQVNALKVVTSSLDRLGEKIIFQYSLIEVASGAVLVSDNLSALRVEDLDQVTKRVVLSLCRQTPVEKTVEVGLVTEQETQEARSRKASSMWGIGFGYLYPSKGYDSAEDIFVWDFRSLYEMKNITVDALLGLRQGISLNVGILYLASRKDFSPFIGGGVGFHAVSHDIYGSSHGENQKSYDGFEVLVKGGLLAFRTYDFRVVIGVEYSATFNEFDDQGFLLTMSVLRAGRKVFGIF